MLELLPLISLGLAFVTIAKAATAPSLDGRLAWLMAAAVAVLFTVFSGIQVVSEGLMPYWTNHTSNLAGNQVWFDLVIAVVIAFYALAPRGRAVGMKLLPWALAVVGTASIALLPMLARLLWLEHQGRAA